MYRRCIYCSFDLGRNDALEAFPIGRSVAFDGAKGRLWAICPKCARWNLAPLEERWEPVEHAERCFRDARLRAQSENIGLAKLPDGTRLIRVGAALAGELAAWRYGDQLVRRRQRYLLAAGAATVAGVALAGGLAWATASGAFFSLSSNAGVFVQHWQRRRVFHHVPAERSPSGRALVLRRWHLNMARLVPGEAGGVALEVPNAAFKDPPVSAWGRYKKDPDPLVLPDAEARRALSRGAVHLNRAGADRKRTAQAVGLLVDAGGAEGYLHDLAATPRPLAGEKRNQEAVLPPAHRLALEMALHEESERRALQGELTMLEAAWREAEEIAGIADRLAIDPGGR